MFHPVKGRHYSHEALLKSVGSRGRSRPPRPSLLWFLRRLGLLEELLRVQGSLVLLPAQVTGGASMLSRDVSLIFAAITCIMLAALV